MNYEVEIELELSRDRVIELFDDPDNLAKWQVGFVSMEHVSGEKGKAGAKSALVYQMGKRRVEMVETILVRDLPVQFDATYDAKGVFNVVRNRFEELGPDRTRWVSENEFRFGGFMKVIGFVMKSAFPKQSLKYMTDFKAFAERGVDVRDQE